MPAQRTIPQRDLRNHYASILREVEAGTEVTVTDRGRPVAKIVPIDSRRTVIPWDELVELFADLPRIDYESFMADVRPPDEETIADLEDPFERWGQSSSTRAC